MIKNAEEDRFLTTFVKDVATKEQYDEAQSNIFLGAIRISKLINKITIIYQLEVNNIDIKISSLNLVLK